MLSYRFSLFAFISLQDAKDSAPICGELLAVITQPESFRLYAYGLFGIKWFGQHSNWTLVVLRGTAHLLDYSDRIYNKSKTSDVFLPRKSSVWS